jgi:ABC-type transporter MlaC component
MRLTILVAAAAIAMPAALTAHPASAHGVTTQAATDVSAAKKKKKPAKKKEENLKAAPSAPSTKDKSTY